MCTFSSFEMGGTFINGRVWEKKQWFSKSICIPPLLDGTRSSEQKGGGEKSFSPSAPPKGRKKVSCKEEGQTEEEEEEEEEERGL